MLGSGGVIVFDDATDMVYQIMRLARFYAHESCAQCTQCREAPRGPRRFSSGFCRGRGRRPTWTCCSISRQHDRQDDLRVVGFVRRPGRVGDQEVQENSKTTSRDAASPSWSPDARRARHPHDRRRPGERSQGHARDRGRQAGRRARAALLLPPGLQVAGVCRMCLVEIEKAPKLQIACATQVAEGMIVRTQSPQAKSGRTGCSSCCSSIIRSTAPSATRRGVRAAGISRSRKVAPPRATPRLREALQPGRGLRPRRAVRPEPLHPVHALRPLHGGRGEGAGAQRLGAGRPRLHRDPFRGRLDHPWAGNVVDLFPSAPSSPRISCTRRAPGSSTRRPSICTGCSQGCTSLSTPARAWWCGCARARTSR